MNAGLFGVGKRAGAPVVTPTSSTATAFLIIDTNIRCQGAHRGAPCGKLLAERAGRPHTHTCPRCGHRNDSESGSWVG